jgi:subtilisin family serine protease
VDGQDQAAGFSSLGGTLMKPEIAAPGVDVVAARAAGTSMGQIVDANYTSASGTSMATPHVAGAAAALLQQHPAWHADRLKAALVSTADAASGTVYQVGGGHGPAGLHQDLDRVDVPVQARRGTAPAAPRGLCAAAGSAGPPGR